MATYYDEMRKTSLDHLKSPKAGDYWHEMFCFHLIVLEVLDDGVIVCSQTKEVEGGRTIDIEKSRFMTLDHFRNSMCYPRMHKPFCDVMVGQHQPFVDMWKARREKLLPRIMESKPGRHGLWITPHEIEDHIASQMIEYASLTLDGKRLRLSVTPSTPPRYMVEHGCDVLYSGSDIWKATRAFNEA